MRLRHSFLAALLLSGVGGPALAEIDVLSVTFTCENNATVPVAYFNPTEGPGAAAMLIDGRLIALRQVQSGSGIRYESESGAGTYTLRSKGWEATITYQPAGDTSPERLLYRDCVSR